VNKEQIKMGASGARDMIRRSSHYLHFLLCLTALFNGVALAGPGFENSLDLRIDARQRARAFSNGLQPVLKFGEHFEFFERSLTGKRRRIVEGPWQGRLSETRPGRFILGGEDSPTGMDFRLLFRQVNRSTIKLTYQFRTPDRPSHLQCNVAKLASDLFTGALLEAEPVHVADAGVVPLAPRSMDKRMLLAAKNRVRLRGAFMDLEIEDLAKSRSLFVADGRNVPWDKRKSLIVGVVRDGLAAGDKLDLRYRIRRFPPTGVESAVVPVGSGDPVLEPNLWTFFTLPPKEETILPGMYQLQPEDVIVASDDSMAAHFLADELKALAGSELPVVPDRKEARRGIVFEAAQASELPYDGFAIRISPDWIVIRGADRRSLLYGALALMSRLQHTSGGGWEWPCCSARDWPDLHLRGLCLELLKPPIRDVGLMKRYVNAAARARVNTLVLLHVPPHILSWRDGRDDGNWTPDQMAEIAAHARALGMDVWGGMTSSFHAKDFPKMDIQAGSDLYHPNSDSAYDSLFSLYDQILKTYQPTTLLIAHDEIRGLNLYATETGKSTATLFAEDVMRIHSWLKKRKVNTALWGDMLLDHATWETKVGSANSNNPAYNSGATHEAVSSLPSDVQILDWHYRFRSDYPSLQHFREFGFATLGVTWYDPIAAKSLAESVKHYGGQGIITTDWGFWPTLSPAATTLVAPLCGWSAACPSGEDGSDLEALAASLRGPDHQLNTGTQIPIQLDAVANAQLGATDEDAGVFGQGPALDLAALIPGTKEFCGVQFEISPWAVVAETDTAGTPGQVMTLFEGRERADRIALLQTCLVEAPQAAVRLLGRLLIEYESGRVETIDLIDNWNVTDVRSTIGLRNNVWSFNRSPDVLIGAYPAWRGTSTTDIPLNLQAFIWKNSYPEDDIRSIRLSAAGAPPGTRLVIVGLTLQAD